MRAAILILVLASACTQRSSAPTPPADAALQQQREASADAPPAPAYDDAATASELGLSSDEFRRAVALQPLVVKASRAQRIDPNLLNALIQHESRFHADARNRSGATGLMQLMPKTSRALAKRMGRANRPRDPEFSVQAGALLIRSLLDLYNDNLDLALFGFAQGSGKVRAWKRSGGPYPPRVRRFIRSIREHQKAFARHGFPDAPRAKPRR